MAPSAELRKLDAEVAAVVDGWTEIDSKYGELRGKPFKGLRRPVVAYSTDLRRAMQVARKAVRSHGAVRSGASIEISVTSDEVGVSAFNPATHDWFTGQVERTDALPELLARAALHVAKK